MRLVTTRDVERYKTERLKSVSPVSVNVELRCLKAAFNVAVSWGMIESNPFAKSKLLRIPLREPAYLTRDDFEKLLALISDEELRSLLIFAVGTMMRRGEIVSLTWEDVDFGRKSIRICSKQDFTVKGHRPRVIPMSETVFHLLSKKNRKSKFVFTKSDGSPLKGAYISREFKRHMRKCGLSESLHFHSLRHSGATWLVQQDVPIYAIQKILGHSSPVMTETYSHLCDQNLRLAIERINILN